MYACTYVCMYVCVGGIGGGDSYLDGFNSQELAMVAEA